MKLNVRQPYMVPGTWYLLSVLQSIHKIVNDIPHPARLSGIPRNVETSFLLGYRKKAKKNTETRFSGISGNTEKIPKRFSSDGIRHLKTKYRIPCFRVRYSSLTAAGVCESTRNGRNSALAGCVLRTGNPRRDGRRVGFAIWERASLGVLLT